MKFAFYYKLKHRLKTAILSFKLKVAKRRAHSYFNSINGAETVYIMLLRNKFVILTRKHTKKLIRKGKFKPGVRWDDVKRNAIYTIKKAA